MTKYATNNPIGSMDPKDLFDNAQNLDYAVNDITQAIWKDRFGRNRPTMFGMEQSFSAQLLSQQQRFDIFIQSSGYDVVGEYTSGPLTISEYNQLIRYNNELWKLTAATDLPFTTTGNDPASWVNDSAHFVSVGDAALRQELASPGGGNIPGWYDAPSSVRAANHKTPSNSWQDAINSARVASGANSPIVIGANATGAETVPVQYALPSGVSGYHLSQGTSEEPSTDKRPLILLEKVCDSLDSLGPHTMANYSMKYVGGVKGAIPLSSYIEASGTAEGGAIAIQGRAKTTVATSSGWGGWSYIDVQSILPVRAIGHEINVRCNIPSPLEWSASGGIVDGLVIATVDNGSNNMANSAIKVSRSSQGLGFLSGLRFGYRSIVPSDTSDMTKLNGEAILINGGSSNAERYGGIRIGANDGFGFTRFHYGLRTNEAEFNNNVAIWLGDNQRLRWGTQVSSGPYLHYNATDFEFIGAALNVVNGLGSSLKLNSVKVLGPRVTGIFAMTGTADGTAKNTETVTLPELARYVKKGFDALLSHGLMGPT
ncbi:TPA: hypothetical protein MDA92_004496 [Escherichia coli]|nr:hypothetical protein [Escherichia coli]